MLHLGKAAVLEVLGQPLRIRDIEIPELLRGQVLVKILYSGVCRSQLMEAQGNRGSDPWIPHLLGHEGSGIVLETGEGVTKVRPGDEVILGWIKGEGIDAPGAKYLSDGQIINSGAVTTFSNYTIASENRLVLKPSSLNFDTAVLFGCALPTGAGMVLNELAPKLDESILVLGLGGIGLAAVAALKALGIRMIIAADISNEKLELAKRLGASHALNSSLPSFRKELLEIAGEGVDACVESAGRVETIELGFSLIKKRNGKLIFASHPREGEMIKISPHELISGKKIFGSWGGSTRPDIDIPKFHELFKKSATPLNGLLTKKYSLARINEALNDLDVGKVFRPLIVMDHS
jgi:S-(hydroxymethyl)glutathione dehydrogenase/alcohol dehydrogenase